MTKERILIKFGGEIADSEQDLDYLATSLKELNQRGHQVILVHGGGPQLDELAQQLGQTTEKIAGRRVTNGQTLRLLLLSGHRLESTCIHIQRHRHLLHEREHLWEVIAHHIPSKLTEKNCFLSCSLFVTSVICVRSRRK